ncbi:cytochrome c oxidase polypeptide IV mitochondrial precursor [Pyrenophora tritici-repentis]|uniref:Cytochrome c oxidase subunit 4, mitochondrial n=1 Tax=Pyrenophora tritici-repentis TaxID=45151 RepID=A0A2W1E7G8_9PLEO|nr:Cytochrome c oxidase polypeptide IV mitochondrial [Pyrenophora tritici-repentis]KAF7573210.1 cytochrome c oxidase polypeptide IV, mitochondrial precursor [Pyrenophora tritici-repentis]KAG9381189.1 Cytochrome c oxidase polypeptide IV mitochondrial [Pyrenophora tritici-repentis]KAI0583604.1 cytochrome c oxidase polypeptide IV mitochondrial [Pyrenophora tritici-repentis]KAI0610383.1 Cytochrome c oxidase polypeptide IV mitochondrial [Pyrenophora tritici-repentis]
MFLQRSAIAVARRAAPRVLAQRTFTTSFVHRDASSEAKEAKENNIAQKETGHSADSPSVLAGFKKLDEIKSEADLLPPGAKPGTVPTDAEQATGLERLEILGKMQGIDIFDMRPLDASRLGTMEDPITVNAAGDEQYVGCTGFPADSHNVLWITLTRDEPKSRCMECGSVYEMHYVGPQEDAHGHSHSDHHAHPVNPYPKPKNMADFLKPEYQEL